MSARHSAPADLAEHAPAGTCSGTPMPWRPLLSPRAAGRLRHPTPWRARRAGREPDAGAVIPGVRGRRDVGCRWRGRSRDRPLRRKPQGRRPALRCPHHVALLASTLRSGDEPLSRPASARGASSRSARCTRFGEPTRHRRQGPTGLTPRGRTDVPTRSTRALHSRQVRARATPPAKRSPGPEPRTRPPTRRPGRRRPGSCRRR